MYTVTIYFLCFKCAGICGRVYLLLLWSGFLSGICLTVCHTVLFFMPLLMCAAW